MAGFLWQKKLPELIVKLKRQLKKLHLTEMLTGTLTFELVKP